MSWTTVTKRNIKNDEPAAAPAPVLSASELEAEERMRRIRAQAEADRRREQALLHKEAKQPSAESDRIFGLEDYLAATRKEKENPNEWTTVGKPGKPVKGAGKEAAPKGKKESKNQADSERRDRESREKRERIRAKAREQPVPVVKPPIAALDLAALELYLAELTQLEGDDQLGLVADRVSEMVMNHELEEEALTNNNLLVHPNYPANVLPVRALEIVLRHFESIPSHSKAFFFQRYVAPELSKAASPVIARSSLETFIMAQLLLRTTDGILHDAKDDFSRFASPDVLFWTLNQCIIGNHCTGQHSGAAGGAPAGSVAEVLHKHGSGHIGLHQNECDLLHIWLHTLVPMFNQRKYANPRLEWNWRYLHLVEKIVMADLCPFEYPDTPKKATQSGLRKMEEDREQRRQRLALRLRALRRHHMNETHAAASGGSAADGSAGSSSSSRLISNPENFALWTAAIDNVISRYIMIGETQDTIRELDCNHETADEARPTQERLTAVLVQIVQLCLVTQVLDFNSKPAKQVEFFAQLLHVFVELLHTQKNYVEPPSGSPLVSASGAGAGSSVLSGSGDSSSSLVLLPATLHVIAQQHHGLRHVLSTKLRSENSQGGFQLLVAVSHMVIFALSKNDAYIQFLFDHVPVYASETRWIMDTFNVSQTQIRNNYWEVENRMSFYLQNESVLHSGVHRTQPHERDNRNAQRKAIARDHGYAADSGQLTEAFRQELLQRRAAVLGKLQDAVASALNGDVQRMAAQQGAHKLTADQMSRLTKLRKPFKPSAAELTQLEGILKTSVSRIGSLKSVSLKTFNRRRGGFSFCRLLLLVVFLVLVVGLLFALFAGKICPNQAEGHFFSYPLRGRNNNEVLLKKGLKHICDHVEKVERHPVMQNVLATAHAKLSGVLGKLNIAWARQATAPAAS